MRIDTLRTVLRRLIYTFWIGLMLFGGSVAGSADVLTIAGVEGSADAAAGEAVVREAYRRLGLEIEMRWLSGEEALAQSNSGSVDGELQRIDGIAREFHHLVQVPIPINYLQGAAFSERYDFPIRGWFSLKPYRIGIVKGVLFATQGTAGMEVQIADTYEALIELLTVRDIEVAVMPRINGLVAISKHQAAHIRELPGVLETLFLYHYLHRKNEHLVPALQKEFKRMLLDGTIQQIRKRAYADLLTGAH